MMRNVFTKVIKSYLKNKQFYLEREVSLSLLFLGKVSDFSDIKLLPLFNVFIERIEWVKMQQKKLEKKTNRKDILNDLWLPGESHFSHCNNLLLHQKISKI
jgi:hypothetical protein